MKGSQKARLLVASQQRLVSRLQDLSHQLDSIDNEVTRVKGDIISSRRYFSAMTGIPYGPDWPATRQMDSAYTSPTSCLSPRSSDDSPSDTDWPATRALGATSSPTQEVSCRDAHFRSSRRDHCASSVVDNANYRHQSQQARSPYELSQHTPTVQAESRTSRPNQTITPSNRLHPRFSSPAESNRRRHGVQTGSEQTCYQNTFGADQERRGSGPDRLLRQFDNLAHLESPFKSLADFNELGAGEGCREGAGLMSGGPLLTRSDSCSSFMSWRSDQEMASLFPDEADSGSTDTDTRYGGR
ncbi:hypothetical protein ElyMa_006333100 [Elysia marginata]|uniref:Uncharacterized protein n=1 Tax=Elysia marginata TaxID=1093978 RepID=A0AAV4HK78_9GAST|nr:hypothetical protein ElyMa_006333100 [Elysia marginata]